MREGLWLMQCLTADSTRAANNQLRHEHTGPPSQGTERPSPSGGNILTDRMISTVIRKDLDVFESPRFLNLAQGLQTRETDIVPATAETGAHFPSEAPPCRGPRISMDFGTEFTETDALPWSKWGHKGTTKRGVCKQEITTHMPASVARQTQFERYEGHREPEEAYALGFVAHLTPMDLGQTPTSQNLVNMQDLEKLMCDRRPLHPSSETPSTPWDMNFSDWPPDPSGKPPPPSGGGGPP